MAKKTNIHYRTVRGGELKVLRGVKFVDKHKYIQVDVSEVRAAGKVFKDADPKWRKRLRNINLEMSKDIYEEQKKAARRIKPLRAGTGIANPTIVAESKALRPGASASNSYISLKRRTGREIGAEFGGVKYDRFGQYEVRSSSVGASGAGKWFFPTFRQQKSNKMLQAQWRRRTRELTEGLRREIHKQKRRERQKAAESND